jgi:hypothetical protein
MHHAKVMTSDEKGIRTYGPIPHKPKGTGPDSGGQSGDTQGVLDEELEQLLEEGQFYEAEVMESVEDAPDADAEEVHTRQVPEDDVPGEYLDQERKRDE